MLHQNQSSLTPVAATSIGGEAFSARSTDHRDAWRFAEAIVRDNGPRAHSTVQERVRLLEWEGKYEVAKLWRDVAEAITLLQAMQTDHPKAKGPPH